MPLLFLPLILLAILFRRQMRALVLVLLLIFGDGVRPSDHRRMDAAM